ncbi:hypothetical protein RB195_025587 [Necator americanus]|uniref:Uncharacterized protein n=1 Tax=Necator americanus TaxID=51031 RepID=A0ABR1ESZ3_NECAM
MLPEFLDAFVGSKHRRVAQDQFRGIPSVIAHVPAFLTYPTISLLPGVDEAKALLTQKLVTCSIVILRFLSGTGYSRPPLFVTHLNLAVSGFVRWKNGWPAIVLVHAGANKCELEWLLPFSYVPVFPVIDVL